MRELGVVICNSNTPNEMEFWFEIKPNVEVRTEDFVKVPIKTGFILGKITTICAFNKYYADQRFINSQLRNGIAIEERLPISVYGWKLAHVDILGAWEGGQWISPKVPPSPGQSVEEADAELISSYLGISEKGVFIGFLSNNPRVKIKLDPDKLVSHHIAVLGSTGSGKSHTCSVIIEELLEMGVPVVVIDPHGEYRYMESPNLTLNKGGEENFSPKGYNTVIFSLAESIDRKRLSFDLAEFSPEVIAELASLNSEQQVDLLYVTVETLKQRNIELNIDNILTYIDEIGKIWNFYSSTITTVKRKLMVISHYKIFGRSTDVKEIVIPGTLTIIDLSDDIDEKIRRAVIAALLNKLFESRKQKIIPPLLVVIEESHRWAPQTEETVSKYMIRRIVREGRKFGIGICLTSQRIVGMDKDVLSQCNTKITLKVDSKTDLDYIKPYLGFGSSHEFKYVPLLPRGVGIISGVCVRTPIMAKIRPRRSKHGGVGVTIKQTTIQ